MTPSHPPMRHESLPKWALGSFVRPVSAQPIIRPNPQSTFPCPLRQQLVAWEVNHTFNPAATVLGDQIAILYRAEDNQGPGGIGGYTSRLGLAISADGLTFHREPHPVLFPGIDSQEAAEWSGGCEDPRLVQGPDGTYVVTYTQYQGNTPEGGWGAGRIGLATSRDLRTWTKHGSAFAGTAHEQLGAKSAGILQTLDHGRLVAAQVNGCYWMYFGEAAVHLATSPDLIHWTPVVDAAGRLLPVLSTRPGYFDSELAEVGPPPILTDHGIILIYNGKNAEYHRGGDPSLTAGIYACGQVLFAKDDPARPIDRLDQPFFQPELPWEATGQYTAGTTFAEGLVFFNDRWFLYYGCADTFVGVAVTGTEAT